jgi:hypothetical protein
MSPPVADLGEEDTQAYTDGQLKWIIENGIRFTGMPSFGDGLLKDDEMWHIVRFLRHLPRQGSLGVPSMFQEPQEREGMKNSTEGPGHHTQSDETKPQLCPRARGPSNKTTLLLIGEPDKDTVKSSPQTKLRGANIRIRIRPLPASRLAI